jgi:hypothetical protein
VFAVAGITAAVAGLMLLLVGETEAGALFLILSKLYLW